MNTSMTVNLPRRGRTASVTAVVLIAALALAACGSDDSSTNNTTATTTGETPSENTADATGDVPDATRQFEAENGVIEIPVNPQQIVTIGNTTMPFIDLGGEPVGVTEIRGSQINLVPAEQQATYAAATNLGTSADEIDLEKLASLEPDLILAQFPGSEFEQIEQQLQSIAPTLFWGLGAEWKEFADGLADAGNLTEGLSQQKAEFADKIADIQETYADIIANTSFVNVDRWASSDPGTFSISDFGCVEIAQDDIGMDFPRAAEGDDPLGWTALPFEQIAELVNYDVITYPVDDEGNPTEEFAPVVETNTWTALPNVQSGRALGVFCPGNNSYGPVLQYLDSLDSALASLPTEE